MGEYGVKSWSDYLLFLNFLYDNNSQKQFNKTYINLQIRIIIMQYILGNKIFIKSSEKVDFLSQ